MATIPGSQFAATAPGQTVNIVETTTGGGIANDTVNGDFNLEVYIGSMLGGPALPAPGYDGLAILSPSGIELDLINGQFAAIDFGAGGKTLGAYGLGETITGSTGDTLNLFGQFDTAVGGPGDTININGLSDSVTAGDGNTINDFGVNDQITAAANDTITFFAGGGHAVFGGSQDVINDYGMLDAVVGGANDTIFSTGAFFTVNDLAPGAGNNLIYSFGAHASVFGGDGDTVNSFGNFARIGLGVGTEMVTATSSGDTIIGGTGQDTITVFASSDVIVGAGVGGSTSITAIGNFDTVVGNAGSDTVNFLGANETFLDGGTPFADTVSGFSQAAGDTIHLAAGDTVANSTLQPNGLDTLITLSDNSTILLKGVSHVDASFFS